MFCGFYGSHFHHGHVDPQVFPVISRGVVGVVDRSNLYSSLVPLSSVGGCIGLSQKKSFYTFKCTFKSVGPVYYKILLTSV